MIRLKIIIMFAAKCFALLACLLQLGCAPEKSTASTQQEPETPLSLHHRLLTLDTHIDIPNALGTLGADFRKDGPMQVDLPKMQAGGLDAAFFIVYVPQGPVDEAGYEVAYKEAMLKFRAINRMLDNSPHDLALVTTPDELRAAVAQGKRAVAIGVENAYPLGKELQHLQEFYELGARYISLTHFGHNHFGDSSKPKGEQQGVPEPVNNGLSHDGLALIERMNELGIMVDVSHTSIEATFAAVAHSKTPVIASHSGARAVFDHFRNLTDKEIKAIAATGGVVQLVAFDTYLREVTEQNQQAFDNIRIEQGLTDADWYRKVSQTENRRYRDARAALHDQFPRATIDDYVDHIEYVIKLVGDDHVGISSDFGGGGGVHGWDSIDQTPKVTEALLARGYTAEQLQKIWSGNLLRVWQVVEDYAQSRRSNHQ